ncbi:MAG: thiamine pyrophosphate-dependent dehydrogenase E1 component subunit alpha [Chloroflexi bacterium]|nr:thiamine pyrophosphate-dependent dehydrogenase E1 component subunit alpha [Chloroflexota bacterium]
MPTERAADLLRRMLRIRRLEEKLVHLAEDKTLIRAHYHLYVGQEAAGVGVCSALRRDDLAFTTHRNHGHVIAKGGDPFRVIAEVIGRRDGYLGGRGGTFHVAAPEIGIPHTSAIVGGSLPIAAGTAWAAKLARSDRVTVVFFGDGVMEEGVFYETLNIAQLWRLPILFYMENNSVTPEERPGRGSPTSSHAATALSDIPRAFGIDTTVLDGTRVDEVAEKAAALVARLRKGEGPLFVESRTTRWPGNYGSFPRLPGGDTDIAWAHDREGPVEEVRSWHAESDPILLWARECERSGALAWDAIRAIDREVREEVEKAAAAALASPPPDPAAALEHTYA